MHVTSAVKREGGQSDRIQSITVALKRLVGFRLHVYAGFTSRADALFEVVDALLLTPTIRSAVEVTRSPAFRRRFASVDDALAHGKIAPASLRQAVVEAEPAEAVTVGGYAVYVADTTIAPRPDAKTVPDRSRVYSAERGKAIPARQFSWLGRVLAGGQSWFAPREVVRVPTERTPTEVGADQVQRLSTDPRPDLPKAVVVDRHDAQPSFLRPFVGRGPRVVVLARLACNRVLYGPPPPPTGKRGRPKVHGAKLSRRAPRPPDREETLHVLGQDVRLSAWLDQHFRALPALVGLVVRVEFLNQDGTPRYRRPLWLFWSGPQGTALADLATMYLLRFAIEHFFRFAKQRLGLLAAHPGDLAPIETWAQVVLIAYSQLLLARHVAQPAYRAWDPTARRDPNRPLTPGQVLAAWPIFSRTLETPAAPPGPAGPPPGRAPGSRPRPRERHPVLPSRKPRTKKAA